ncbi:TPA: O35 family O-antigen flippase, partial [Escherichia coli]|nr:O35 family O-antigen flippase [Escherichia coli]
NIVTYMFGSESVNAKELIYSACIFIFVSIYGPVVTGYFTLKVKGRMIITINIIIALLSLLLGVGMLKIVGSSGWLIGLSLAQLLYFAIFFKIFIWGRKECAV